MPLRNISTEKKQYDPSKPQPWNNNKADLDEWERSAYFYLRRQELSEWTLERDDAKRQATIARNPQWTHKQKHSDQIQLWELSWHTFFNYKKSIFNYNSYFLQLQLKLIIPKPNE